MDQRLWVVALPCWGGTCSYPNAACLLSMTTPRPFKLSHNTLHQLAPAPARSQREGWKIVKLAAFFTFASQRLEEWARCPDVVGGHLLTPKNITYDRKNLPTPFLALSPGSVSMCPEALLGSYFSCRSRSCIIMASLWRQRSAVQFWFQARVCSLWFLTLALSTLFFIFFFLVLFCFVD